ncbi:MAG: RagB/SusD family nutrient uptake outer membrane protein [Bacteroidia bacterium]|nr:RagB/SusD family nutrient uptake outer membrane protein [Bacteroidia bacterium]
MKNIKKHLSLLSLLVGLLISVTSCDKMLNEVPRVGAITPQQMWSNPDFVSDYVNQMYNYLPYWSDRYLTYSEEGPITAENNFLSGFFRGMNSSSDTFPGYRNWDYAAVRTINTFFANIGTSVPSIIPQQLNYLKGQAYFFRAYVYYKMVKVFGGVPIVKGVLSPTAPLNSLMIPRNTTLECFDFIKQQLDSSIALLPPYGTAGYLSGRITKAAAMAVEAQVLLLKASPLFCKTANTQYWNDAYTACAAAKTEADAEGYGLYTSNSLKVNEQMWYDKAGASKEKVLFAQYSNPSKTMGYFTKGQRPLIFSANRWGDAEPTWELVQAYPMSNGKEIGAPGSGYDPTLFWKNRDPRFYCTVVYNGAPYSFADAQNRFQWLFPGLPLQGYLSPAGNLTGFFCRKGIDTTFTSITFPQQAWDWPIIRYAEIVLDLAECANEIDAHRSEATALISGIRNRAHILPGTDNRFGLTSAVGTDYQSTLNAIMKERQIEFSYEGKRFWDLRRRRMYSVFNNYGSFHAMGPYFNASGLALTGITGITNYGDMGAVTARLNALFYNNNSTGLNFDDVIKASTSFKEELLDQSGATINIPDAFYFAPINPNYIKQSNNLKQNKGWDNGDFDPTIQ